MNFIRWTGLALLAALALAGCQSAPAVPDNQYYRLRAEPAAGSQAPLFKGDVAVRTLRTDGLYSERAVIFAENRRLEQYHYHHWLYPPGQLVQEHLAQWLRRSGAAPAVQVQEHSGETPYVVSGRVARFEESREAGRRTAEVALDLRLEAHGRVLFQHPYQTGEPVAEAGMNGLAAAMEVALDRIYGEFLADLRRAPLE